MEIHTHYQKRYCIFCRSEQEHQFIYLDRYLKSGRCLSCNHKFNNRDDLFDVYVHDTIERILSKPLRIFRNFGRLHSAQPHPSAKKSGWIPTCIKLIGDEVRNVHQIWSTYDFDSNSTVAIHQTELFICLTKFWGKKFKSILKRIVR